MRRTGACALSTVCLKRAFATTWRSPQELRDLQGKAMGWAPGSRGWLRQGTFLVAVLNWWLRVIASAHSQSRGQMCFASGLGKNLESFRGDGAVDALQQSDAVFWVSGEAAVPDRISGGGLVDLYVDDSSSVRSFVRLGRMRASESGAITIKKSFWDLEEVGLETARVAARSSALSGRLRAPIAIVYADLWASGAPRLVEIAYQIKREIIEQVENAHDAG